MHTHTLSVSFYPSLNDDDEGNDDDDNVKWRNSQALIAIVLSYMIRWVFHVNIIKPRVKKQNKLNERRCISLVPATF